MLEKRLSRALLRFPSARKSIPTPQAERAGRSRTSPRHAACPLFIRKRLFAPLSLHQWESRGQVMTPGLGLGLGTAMGPVSSSWLWALPG